MIQKEILNIFASIVWGNIHKEIEKANFCILVEEFNESHMEKMAIILRFFYFSGFM